MDDPLYENAIRTWCEATGMLPWPVDEPQHIELDGFTVGLLYDRQRPDRLDVLCELEPAARADSLRALLQANADPDLPFGGCYALHPETDAVVFRLCLPLAPDTDGATLPATLRDAFVRARELLDN